MKNYPETFSKLIKVALNPQLVEPITDYLNETPILSEVRLIYSPNTNDHNSGSQEFHLDGEDTTAMKVFFNLSENDAKIPTQVAIESKKSAKVRRKFGFFKTLKKIRFDEKFIYENVDSKDLYEFYGKPGEIWGMDTCQSIHYGSRKANKPRLLFWAMYLPRTHYTFPLNVRSEYQSMDLGPHINFQPTPRERYLLRL